MFKKVKILANSENQCVTEKPRTVICPQEDLANRGHLVDSEQRLFEGSDGS